MNVVPRQLHRNPIRNADGSYSFQHDTNLTRTPCGLSGTTTPPAGAVAWVHTHPYKPGEIQNHCDPSNPTYYFSAVSPEDRAMCDQWNLPGYFIDATFIVKFGKDATQTPNVMKSRCGY